MNTQAADLVAPVAVAPAPRASAGTAAAAWALAAVIAALLVALYWTTFAHLLKLWDQDPNYSHGYLVPFISAFLIWRRWVNGPAPAQGEPQLGFLYVLAGGIAHAAAVITNFPPIDFVSMVLVLRGLAIALGGRPWANGFVFPMLFLFFMFPLPVTWTGAFANWLQDIVSRATRFILKLFVTCEGRGNTIRLTGADGSIHSLSVAEECSGLRQIVAFVALASLIGYWSGRRPMYGLALMISAVPAAVAANVVRVLIMAFAARWFGTDWLNTALHHAPVIVTLPLGLGLLLLFGWGLGKVFRKPPEAAAAPSKPSESSEWRGAAARRLYAPAAGLAVSVLLILGLHWHLHSAEPFVRQELRAPLESFEKELTLPTETWEARFFSVPIIVQQPMRWKAPEISPEQVAETKAKMQEKIKFGEDLFSRGYARVNDRNEWAGPSLRLYMVYSAVGEDRNHHPEICIGVAMGLDETRDSRKRFDLQGDKNRPVQRYRYDTGNKEIYTVYYWYYTLDPVITERHSFLQVLYLRQQRLPSLTVQVSTQAPLSAAALAEIENSFLVAIDAEIRRTLVPANARMGCTRAPIKWTGTKVE